MNNIVTNGEISKSQNLDSTTTIEHDSVDNVSSNSPNSCGKSKPSITSRMNKKVRI